MAAAYQYADGGRPSREIRLSQYIQRFGVNAVLGRPLYAREIYRITIAENVVNAFRSFRASQNAAEWARGNPEMAALLNKARLMAEKNG